MTQKRDSIQNAEYSASVIDLHSKALGQQKHTRFFGNTCDLPDS